MRRSVPTLLMSLALVAGCTGASDPDPGSSNDAAASSDIVQPVGGDLRIGEPWYLVGGMLESAPTTDVMLTFDEDTVGGQGPVNSYTADYTAATDGALDLGRFVTSLEAGPDELERAETDLLFLLNAVDGYATVAAGELYLFEGDQNVLVYATSPPSYEPTISDETQAMALEILGMSEADARAIVEDAGTIFRVVSRDGEDLVVTEDYSVIRINATVVDDEVTRTTIG